MPKKSAFFAALAACAAGAPSASAQDAATLPDLRCFALAIEMSASTDAGARSAGFGAEMYFLGRLDGRAPALDLERALSDLPSLSTSESQAERTRCGFVLMERGRQITEIGRSLDLQSQQSNP